MGGSQLVRRLNLLNLTEVKAKISQAREDLQTFEADIAAFCEYERRRRVFEIKQGWPVIVSENIPETPTEYARKVGDIACRLRSALDHLIWEIVKDNKDNGENPSSRINFPICCKKADFRKWAKRRSEEMTRGQIEVIKFFQPFQKDSVFGPHLWMLNYICNIDKHRHLNEVALHSREDISLKEGVDPNLTWPLIGGRDLWNMLKGMEHENKVHIRVIADICFVDEKLEAASVGYGSEIEKEGVKRPSVIPVLWGCLTAVQFVVDRCNSLFMTWKQGKTLGKEE